MDLVFTSLGCLEATVSWTTLRLQCDDFSKITGGSGIQWPCTERYLHGKTRIFDDGVFLTDIDYCESHGHDLETGAPMTKDQCRAMNWAGRAILKAADYIPLLHSPDAEYPLQLSTGRQVYQCHTRTKTGGSKVLQDAAPSLFVELKKRPRQSSMSRTARSSL